MKPNSTKGVFYGIVLLLVVAGAFSGGLVIGWGLPGKSASDMLVPSDLYSPGFLDQPGQTTSGTPVAQLTAPAVGSTKTPAELNTLFKPFWEAWRIVHEDYVDQPVEDNKLMQGAISGMMSALGDPHSSYMDPDQSRQANVPLEGGYEGIGAWVDTTGGYLVITNPMPGSPAEKAGIKPGDVVVAVDGQDMTGVVGNLVLRKILGPAGTKVTLTILRKSEPKPIDVTIERAKIVIPDLKAKMLDQNIAYIQLFTFGGNTASELHNTLVDLLAKKPDGVILDLRNNGGGYLDTAILVVSEFIKPDQVVMYEQFGDGTRKTYKSSSGGVATDIPLVVLVNEGSASASEITAGAIQDYQRGLLIGTTTYGKGSVQNWIPLGNNEGIVRVTVARWLTPKERNIHKNGLKPDVEVKLTEEDLTNKKDPQLDKAIEILLKK